MRNWAWAGIAVAFWLLAVHVQSGSTPLPPDAPRSDFSGLRAKAALGRVLGSPEHPHPAGSLQNAAVQERIQNELARLGIHSAIVRRMSCYSKPSWQAVECSAVNNIVAEIVPGQGKAVILMAHSDSVPAGPGAGDDGAGVATILEVARAMKAAPAPARHPVWALFTDGEEMGLLGAASFIQDPAWRDRAGVMVNVEARGSSGNSLLFQTSPGDGALIDLYAGTAKHPATSSLYEEIYRILPNDTDLTPFLGAGITGYNFAIVGGVADYHTPLDTLARLDARSLQSHGDNVLGLTRSLAQTDYASLQRGNAIYLDVLGLWLPRLPQSWALPLALLVFLAIALTAWLARRRDGGWFSALVTPLFLAGAAASGFALQWLASWIAHVPDPAYAQPLALRLALALGVATVALLAARRASLHAAWLWLAAAGVAAAWFLPGLTPYFLFPSLLAAVVLPFAGRRPWLAAVPALASLLVWMQLVAAVEVLMGLAQGYFFTVPLALGLVALLPLLQGRGSLLAGALAIAVAIGAGFVPPYDANHPRRQNLIYAEEDGKAYFLGDTLARVPVGLRGAAHFYPAVQWLKQRGLAKPAGNARFSPPAAQVMRQGKDIDIQLAASGDSVLLGVPETMRLKAVTINGVTTQAYPGTGSVFCSSPDCGHAHIVLHLDKPAAGELALLVRNWGLPPGIAAHPANAVPSQFGDMTVLITRLNVPGG